MGTWNSRGLRGSTLEDLINRTNERYDELDLALIQKIPTPITPVQIDKERRHITLAYFDKISTVDYIGSVQGIPVCFDAKECSADTFRFKISMNIRCGLWKNMKYRAGFLFSSFITVQGIFFIICVFEIVRFNERREQGGRKSFRLEELDERYFMHLKNNCFVPYLDFIQKDLDEREELGIDI